MTHQPHPHLLPPSLLPPSILSLFSSPPPADGATAAATAARNPLTAAIDLLYGVADAALTSATDALPLARAAAFLAPLSPRDPFLAAVATAHAVLVLACVASRRSLTAQVGLLLYAGAAVAAAPAANAWGAAHWARFAARNYFDEPGAFVCVVGCGVPLAVAAVAVGRLVVAAGGETVRAAARQRARKQE